MNQRILTLKRKYIGDRAFYRMTLAVAVPIMVQNGITNFVSLLDNIMVGSTGKIPMSGVSIVNQLLFVYSLCIFGALSGAGIFTAQYYGQDDTQGIRHTFRYKLWLGVILTAGAVALFAFRGDRLISLYLDSEENTPAVVAETLEYGLKYLRIMLLGLPPFMLVQTYTSTLRETSETLLPMRAGIAAVLTNLVFNALLIYGLLGFPALGVEGAAMATVISRYVEAAIVLTWTHSSPDRCPWAVRIYRTLRVPAAKARQFFVRGFPLLANEALWSTGITFLNQCYSVRGVDVVASMNISSTVSNLFMIIFTTLGSAVAIIVGQLLGRGSMDEARERAELFLRSHGFEDLSLLEQAQSACLALFSYVREQDGVLCPEDPLRLSIALDDGSLYSFDATKFDPEPIQVTWAVEEDGAREALPASLREASCVRMILRSPGGKPVPCYVFSARDEDGRAVEISVSAESGKQFRIRVGA